MIKKAISWRNSTSPNRYMAWTRLKCRASMTGSTRSTLQRTRAPVLSGACSRKKATLLNTQYSMIRLTWQTSRCGLHSKCSAISFVRQPISMSCDDAGIGSKYRICPTWSCGGFLQAITRQLLKRKNALNTCVSTAQRPTRSISPGLSRQRMEKIQTDAQWAVALHCIFFRFGCLETFQRKYLCIKWQCQ